MLWLFILCIARVQVVQVYEYNIKSKYAYVHVHVTETCDRHSVMHDHTLGYDRLHLLASHSICLGLTASEPSPSLPHSRVSTASQTLAQVATGVQALDHMHVVLAILECKLQAIQNVTLLTDPTLMLSKFEFRATQSRARIRPTGIWTQ